MIPAGLGVQKDAHQGANTGAGKSPGRLHKHTVMFRKPAHIIIYINNCRSGEKT